MVLPSASIRHAVASDAPLMYMISRNAHLEGYFDYVDANRLNDLISRYTPSKNTESTYVTRMVRRIARPQKWLVLAAYVDDALAGFTLTRLHGASSELNNIFVDPGMQGKGVGTALLTRTLQLIGNVEVTLTVLEKNARARALYSTHGFIENGVADRRFYGATQVIMTRPATGAE